MTERMMNIKLVTLKNSNRKFNDPINVLSLFDGISCGRIALDRAGIAVDSYFACEIDKNVIAISRKNYKNIIQLGDITNWHDWIDTLPKIDLILAGSPCQGFSRSGKGLNFDDPRSRLFFCFVDILNYIKRKNNKDVIFLLENVVMKKEWELIISNHVGVNPILINSSLLSAQNRPRLYWTNIKNIQQPPDHNIFLTNIIQKDFVPVYTLYNGILFSEDISDGEKSLVSRSNNHSVKVRQATRQGYLYAHNGDGINLSFPNGKTRRGRVQYGKSSTLDCSCNTCVMYDDTIRHFSQLELERLQTLPDFYTYGFSYNVACKAIGNAWTVDVIAYILSYVSINGDKYKC